MGVVESEVSLIVLMIEDLCRASKLNINLRPSEESDSMESL